MTANRRTTRDAVVADLLARVEALEERMAVASPPAAQPATADNDALWALRGLQDRLAPGTGAVLLTGAVPLQGGASALWQQGHLSDDLLDGDPHRTAARLSALGSPVRLRLLRQILGGRTGFGELAADPQFGTSGQVQHHLRQLVNAGWLTTTSRGHYAVPVDRVVPLLAACAAACD